MDFIKTQNVTFSYEQEDDDETLVIDVLKDVSLNVKKGEFLAILGHNGSGKSTIAKHFNAIFTPKSGEVYIKEMNTKEEENLYEIRQTVGMVFQNPDNQIVATIVEEDVAFALENMGVEPNLIREKVDKALKTVGMYEYKEHAPHRLSGGQKQRVAIAGVIAMRPKAIIMDEPTAMLDPKGRKEVLKTIKKLNKEHDVTIVLITHYMNEAAMADRIIVMDDGKIIMNDVPKKVFSQVEKLKEVGLDVPQVTQLTHRLISEGYDINPEIIDEDECVEAILKIMEKKNGKA